MSERGSAGTTATRGGGERRQLTAHDDEREPTLELPPRDDHPPLPPAQVAGSTEETEDTSTRDARKRMKNDLRRMEDAPSEVPPPPPTAAHTFDAFDEEMLGDDKKNTKQEIKENESPDWSETPRDFSAGESGGRGASSIARRADHPRSFSLEDHKQPPSPPMPPTIETESAVQQPPTITSNDASLGTSASRNINRYAQSGQVSNNPAIRPPPPLSTSAEDTTPTFPSIREVEATLVDSEVYQATRLSEGHFDRADNREDRREQPQHRLKYAIIALIIIIAAMAGIIGMMLVYRGGDEDNADTSTQGQDSEEVVVDTATQGGDEDDIDDIDPSHSVGVRGANTTVPSSSIGPSPMTSVSSAPTKYFFPSNAPSTHLSGVPSALPTPGFCFQDDKAALRAAVNDYTSQRCIYDTRCTVGQLAGWPMNSWCVSQVTDMSSLFKDMETFNDDISSWDTSNVRTMSEMFHGASAFNGDLSSWNVSSVSSMDQMFRDANSFNSNLSSWDVSRVTTMMQMFMESSVFNGDVSPWDVSNVTHMGEMFHCTAFNGDLSSWDVSSVKNMWWMFYFAKSFDQNLTAWNMSNVNILDGMFWAATNFNGDLSRWDTSAVTNMYAVFRFARAFNGDISRWNITSVETMDLMFDTATSFNQNLCAWGDRFPYSEADDIFLNSGCMFKDSPERSKGGPFCASLCS